LKKVIKIKESIDIPDTVIGISSQETDYKIAWEINMLLNIELKKNPDKVFIEDKTSDEVRIPYYFSEETDGLKYFIIRNILPEYVFFKGLKHIDFVLLVLTDSEEDLIKINSLLSKGKNFLGSFIIHLNSRQVRKLKSLLKQ
jgi:hypothetical protein